MPPMPIAVMHVPSSETRRGRQANQRLHTDANRTIAVGSAPCMCAILGGYSNVVNVAFVRQSHRKSLHTDAHHQPTSISVILEPSACAAIQSSTSLPGRSSMATVVHVCLSDTLTPCVNLTRGAPTFDQVRQERVQMATRQRAGYERTCFLVSLRGDSPSFSKRVE